MNRTTKIAARVESNGAARHARTESAKRAKPEVAGDDFFDEAMKRYTDAQQSLLKFFKAPSWKRTLVAFISSLAIAVGVGWVAGAVLEWLVVGAAVMAAPLFLTIAVYVLGVIAAMYYGGKLAARVGGAILTGEADERAIAAYDAVKSTLSRLNPFGKKPELVQA